MNHTTSTKPAARPASTHPAETTEITESNNMSQKTKINNQTTATRSKINNRAHLRITIRRVQEPGQNARNSVWGWGSC